MRRRTMLAAGAAASAAALTACEDTDRPAALEPTDDELASRASRPGRRRPSSGMIKVGEQVSHGCDLDKPGILRGSLRSLDPGRARHPSRLS